MSLKIEETFQIRAPVDRVWNYLVDPRQVVRCLPGAELTEEQADRTYLGRVKVKVGPVTAAYSGKATIVEQDDDQRVVRLAAEGRETAGSGSAKMTMTSRMAALPDGGTAVHVSADVDVVGKVVQFGRGMIESVSKQLFRQFTDCVRARLETEAAPTAPAEGAAAAAAAGVIRQAEGAATAGVPATSAAGGAPRATVAPASAPAVNLVPLLLRALRDLIARLWRRPKRA